MADTSGQAASGADAPNRDEGKPYRRRRWTLATSGALCLGVSLVYWLQPDWLAAVTLVPPWCWLVPGLALAAIGFRGGRKRWAVAVLLLWGVFAAVMVEELQSIVPGPSLPTAAWEAAREQGRAIRVVSLNCYCANRHAAEEVAAWKPDVVLLQESPGREHLAHLARELFGAEGQFVWGGDTSIVAGGRIRPHDVNRSGHFVHATVELPSGLTLDAISLRLNPPVFRLDFWSPGFWAAHRDVRIRHRRQVLAVASRLGTVPPSTPVIVGGDFNAPPYDAAIAPLRERLFDTFAAAGSGWGNTGTNRFPLFRVDQIWASRQFRAVAVTAEKTVHSDHRMVVCDLLVN